MIIHLENQKGKARAVAEGDWALCLFRALRPGATKTLVSTLCRCSACLFLSDRGDHGEMATCQPVRLFHMSISHFSLLVKTPTERGIQNPRQLWMDNMRGSLRGTCLLGLAMSLLPFRPTDFCIQP